MSGGVGGVKEVCSGVPGPSETGGAALPHTQAPRRRETRQVSKHTHTHTHHHTHTHTQDKRQKNTPTHTHTHTHTHTPTHTHTHTHTSVSLCVVEKKKKQKKKAERINVPHLRLVLVKPTLNPTPRLAP